MTTYYYTKCEYPSKIKYDDYENYRIEYTYSWMQHNNRDNCIHINISLTLSPLLDIYSSPAHPTSPLQNKIELKIKMKWNKIHRWWILQDWWQHRDHRHHRLRSGRVGRYRVHRYSGQGKIARGQWSVWNGGSGENGQRPFSSCERDHHGIQSKTGKQPRTGEQRSVRWGLDDPDESG